MYARPEMQPLLEPLVVSWGWHSETPGDSRFTDEQEWQGTRDIAAFLSVPSAIRFMEQRNWAEVRKQCHDLVRYAREGICSMTGLTPLSPDDPAWYMQMTAFSLPACDVDALKRKLYDEFAAEVPVYTWSGKPLIRVSVQAYNTQADVDTLLKALEVLLPQVQA